LPNHYFYKPIGTIQFVKQLFYITDWKKSIFPMEIIDLPNENIGFPKHVVHGPIGTSAWFFPFLTDYFTVRTMA